jgi:membrane protease YdiL (CAAX protease family)
MKERPVIYLVALLALLVICNLAFVYSKGWTRWTWQLFSFGGLLVIYKLASLNLEDIGLSRARIGTGLKYGLATIAIILIVFLALYLINQNIFSDKRYDQSLHAALISALFIVPLQTVLFEELAFRGIMPALLKNIGAGFWITLITSALIFGLWHIATAPKGNLAGVSSSSNLLIIGVVFAATASAGAILYFLRYQSDSLVAPISVHWFVNGLAIVLSSLSWLHRS